MAHKWAIFATMEHKSLYAVLAANPIASFLLLAIVILFLYTVGKWLARSYERFIEYPKTTLLMVFTLVVVAFHAYKHRALLKHTFDQDPISSLILLALVIVIFMLLAKLLAYSYRKIFRYPKLLAALIAIVIGLLCYVSREELGKLWRELLHWSQW